MNEAITYSNIIATLSIIISVFFSIIVIVLNFFRNPELIIRVFDEISIWHEKNNLSIDLRVLFINKYPQPAIISKMSIQIFKKSESNPLHSILWRKFLIFRDKVSGDPSSGKTWDSYPLFPITVTKEKDTTKSILFSTKKCHEINWCPEAGKYRINLITTYLTPKNKEKVLRNCLRLTINQSFHDKMKDNKRQQNSNGNYLIIDNQDK